VADQLPRKLKALSSNPSTANQKNSNTIGMSNWYGNWYEPTHWKNLINQIYYSRLSLNVAKITF
jgi:hypothetical protein